MKMVISHPRLRRFCSMCLLRKLFHFLRKRSPRIRVFDASSRCICFANGLARKQVAPSASALAPLFLLVRFLRFWSSLRSISDSQLNTLLCLHLCPIYLVLCKGSYVLLDGISHLEGGFTLRCLQRLSLPDMATLPLAFDNAADTPAVRPSRSSRTKDSSSQISYARAG